MSCTRDALPLLGYVQYLGDLPERNMGNILPFWAFYKTDLLWIWTNKKLPLADSDYHVEKLLLAFCPSKWRLQRKQIPKNFGLFSTFWTTVVENPSFSEWYFDRGDSGLTALLYFRNFSGGELLPGNPFNFKLPVQNWDLLFLRSSAIYHRSLPFIGNRINLIFYSSIMKGKDIQLNTPRELQ
jgi:hypothetical protein